MPSSSPNKPECLAIIIDGNRRYAREKGISIAEGHQRGYEKVKEVAAWAKDEGFSHLIVYGFSTENWGRSPEEVAHLLSIFTTTLLADAEELSRQGGAVRCIGDLERFGQEFAQKVEHLHRTNPKDPRITITVALSYGGRLEIIRAVNALLAKGVQPPITEETFKQHLWTHDIPDADLVVRTGGEKRLSNFLPWQSVYSELFFIDTPWPAFSKDEFLKILKEYDERERRFGK